MKKKTIYVNRVKIGNAMSGYKTDDLSKMGRRRFIKTLSTLGVSAGAIQGLSKETLAELTDNPEKEVPRIKVHRHTNHEAVVQDGAAPEREPVFYTIPRDEWVRTEGTFAAAEKIADKLPDNPQLITTVGRADPSSSKSSELEVIVRYETHDYDGDYLTPGISLVDVKKRLPEKVNGNVRYGNKQGAVEDVPVRVKEYDFHPNGCSDVHQINHYDNQYRGIPAGCVARCNGTPDPATIATPAYDSGNGDAGWMFTAHQTAFETGHDVYQPKIDWAGDNKCGTTSRAMDPTSNYDEGDAAFIRSNGDYSRKYDIAADQADTYEGWYLYGTVTIDSMKDFMNNGTTIYKQGCNTGRDPTQITGISSDNIWTYVNTDTSDGDSGGPYFYVDEYGQSYMCAIHSGCNSSGENRGTTMDWIENSWPVYV